MPPRVAAALLLLAACKFPYPAEVPDDDAVDADARVTCEPSTIVCDDARGEYVACSATGTVDVAMHCPLGCAPDEEKCLDIDPHNDLATYLDMVANPPDLVLSGPATIETFNGTILDRGVGVTVPTFIRTFPDGTALRVFVVHNFTLDGALTFPPLGAEVRYRPAIAVVATGSIAVRGPIDLSADGSIPGPGGHVAGNTSDMTSCAGQDIYASPPTASRGGSGGGASTAGGNGGETSGTTAPQGGAARTALDPLDGGCFGGSVFHTTDGTMVAGGGSGGGALQLASRVEIQISSAGRIDASGGGGAPALRMGGGGGGAGGIVLLEAPQIILNGAAVVVSTKGGGGAGGSGAMLGGPGGDGGVEPAAARGGSSPVQASGGPGASDGPAQGGAYYQSSTGGGGGGGGGAAGVTAAFTTVGAIAPQNGAAIRGAQMVARLQTRRVP